MGVRPAGPQGCFPSSDVALQSRAFAGWFSYVLSEAEGSYCVRSYTPWEWLFALLLGVMAALATVTCLCVAFIFLRRRLKRGLRGGRITGARGMESFPPISAVVPCYLPNEQHIIEDCIAGGLLDCVCPQV